MKIDVQDHYFIELIDNIKQLKIIIIIEVMFEDL